MAKKVSPRALITDAASILKEIMLVELSSIGDAIVSQIIGRARRLNPSERLKALNDIDWPGQRDYQARLVDALTEIAADSIRGAAIEVPGTGMKLTEQLDSVQFASKSLFDKLPKEMRDKITKAAQFLVGTQLQDLNKAVFFQYQDAYDTTDDFDVLASDLNAAAMEYLDGSAIGLGAGKLAAKTVNDARNAFFFQDDTLEQLDGFEFVNGDPVTAICADLAGTTFAKDDPNAFRYTPPLHWNCKSYIVPILVGKLGNRVIEPLKPSTKKIEDTIQFDEQHRCPHCG